MNKFYDEFESMCIDKFEDDFEFIFDYRTSFFYFSPIKKNY